MASNACGCAYRAAIVIPATIAKYSAAMVMDRSAAYIHSAETPTQSMRTARYQTPDGAMIGNELRMGVNTNPRISTAPV